MALNYQRRSEDSVRERATQRGGNFNSPIKDSFKAFKTHDGDNTIRFLPPTWPDPRHYGMDVYVHYGIGDDTYLCAKEMLNEPCPCCEEYERIKDNCTDDEKRALTPTKRVLVWIVDREKEKEGPMYWMMPWTLDRDINLLRFDKKNGKTLWIDDPKEGYDVSFRKDGKERNTKYITPQVDRDPSYMCNSDARQAEFEDYIVANPLPDILQYFPYEVIQAALTGGGTRRESAADAQTTGRERLREREPEPTEERRRPPQREAEPAGDERGARARLSQEPAQEERRPSSRERLDPPAPASNDPPPPRDRGVPAAEGRDYAANRGRETTGRDRQTPAEERRAPAAEEVLGGATKAAEPPPPSTARDRLARLGKR